ncbi:hypothetical protein ABVK25_011886 [Lepraria finkii]|uniref:Cytochrome P450 n=1 Tax=Lepraria finkii TaxID=1340010 RepID=A0ABR4AJL9_9LECA
MQQSNTMLSISTLGVIIFVVAVYVLSLAVYRLTLHPLAKFPGPKIAAITRWYEAYYDVVKGGQYVFKIGELHKEYGPIVRISPYELHIYDPEFRRELYSNHGRWDKYDFCYNPLGAPHASFAIIDHYEHKERRAVLDPFFSKQKIISLEPLFSSHIQKLSKRIQAFVISGEVLDLGVIYTALTMDILTEYTMGKSMGCLDREDLNKHLIYFFIDFGPLFVVGKHFPLLPWLFRKLPSQLIQRLDVKIAAHKKFTEFCLTCVREVISVVKSSTIEEEKHKTMFRDLLTADGLPATSKKEGTVAQEGEIILSGGTGTVSLPLQHIAYHLSTNPAMLKRLRQELDSIQNPGDINFPKLQQLEKLPYLTAVIMESFRTTYGTVTRLTRIAPDREIQYGGWQIPRGTPVGMSNGLTFDDESYFPDAHSFIPERWLDLDLKEKERLDKIFMPFSSGARMCIGIHFAWTELYLTVAAICTRFDFELYKTTKDDLLLGGDAFLPKMKSNNGVRVIAKDVDLSSL